MFENFIVSHFTTLLFIHFDFIIMPTNATFVFSLKRIYWSKFLESKYTGTSHLNN